MEPAETGFILVSGFTLFSEFRAFCFRVTATNDSNMEEDLTFGIKLFKTMNISARVTIEPDVVMVTITDNDGMLLYSRSIQNTIKVFKIRSP